MAWYVSNFYLLISLKCYGRLRAIFWEDQKSLDTRKKSTFFLFGQNIPFGELV